MKNQKLLDNIYELAQSHVKRILVLASNEQDTELLRRYWSSIVPNILSRRSIYTYAWYDLSTSFYTDEPDVLYVQSGSSYEHFVSKWGKTPSIIEFDISAGLIKMKGPG